MFKLKLRIPNSISDKYWTTFKWPNIIREHMAYCKSLLEDSYLQILRQIEIDSDFIRSSFAAYRIDVKTIDTFDIEKTDDMYNRVQFLRPRLEKLLSLANSVEKRCQLVQVDLNFKPDWVNSLCEKFSYYDKLWSTSWDIRMNLQKWTQSLFIDLNSDFVIGKAVEWTKTITDMMVLFKTSESSLTVVHSLKVHLDDFSRNTNIIKALRNSALRNHHWDQISRLIGFSLHDFSGLSLRRVMDLDLEMIQDVLLDISNQATCEYRIEVSFDSIRMEINNGDFKTESNGTYIMVTNGQRVLSDLENLTIKCQILLASPDSEFLASKISQWINKLQKAEAMLNDLLELQTYFFALLPAFESFSEVVQESECKSFTWVKKFLETWGDILSKNPKYILLIIRNDMHDGILSSITRLESTKHVISQLANRRRLGNSRLYFLSDLEVLKLSTSPKNIKNFNNFVHKCFPNIKSLIFNQRPRGDPNTKMKRSFLASRKEDVNTKKRWTAIKIGVALVLHIFYNL